MFAKCTLHFVVTFGALQAWQAVCSDLGCQNPLPTLLQLKIFVDHCKN